MYEVKEGEILFRVRRFDFQRDEGCISIDVRERVAGETTHEFMAVPNLQHEPCGTEYWGSGGSEREALEDCLRRIKNIPFQLLFPPPK